MDFDVVIIGGGPAGWSAALVLGRCRRDVLVVDDGHPRNAASLALHGFLTRDGVSPKEFLQLARDDALRYPSVRWRSARAVDATRTQGGFQITLESGARVAARKVVLATGVVDELPPIEGIERFYGRSVHHCPYCDAFEHCDRPMAVYGRGEDAVGLALAMTLWSPDVVLCTDGVDPAVRAQQERLERGGVRLLEVPLERLEGDSDGRLSAVVFRDGTRLPREAMFFHSEQQRRSPLAARLGCHVDEQGEALREHAFEETSVPGVYVVGDATKDLMLVVVAAAEGAKAAFAVNRALLADELR